MKVHILHQAKPNLLVYVWLFTQSIWTISVNCVFWIFLFFLLSKVLDLLWIEMNLFLFSVCHNSTARWVISESLSYLKWGFFMLIGSAERISFSVMSPTSGFLQVKERQAIFFSLVQNKHVTLTTQQYTTLPLFLVLHSIVPLFISFYTEMLGKIIQCLSQCDLFKG